MGYLAMSSSFTNLSFSISSLNQDLDGREIITAKWELIGDWIILLSVTWEPLRYRRNNPLSSRIQSIVLSAMVGNTHPPTVTVPAPPFPRLPSATTTNHMVPGNPGQVIKDLGKTIQKLLKSWSSKSKWLPMRVQKAFQDEKNSFGKNFKT